MNETEWNLSFQQVQYDTVTNQSIFYYILTTNANPPLNWCNLGNIETATMLILYTAVCCDPPPRFLRDLTTQIIPTGVVTSHQWIFYRLNVPPGTSQYIIIRINGIVSTIMGDIMISHGSWYGGATNFRCGVDKLQVPDICNQSPPQTAIEPTIEPITSNPTWTPTVYPSISPLMKVNIPHNCTNQSDIYVQCHLVCNTQHTEWNAQLMSIHQDFRANVTEYSYVLSVDSFLSPQHCSNKFYPDMATIFYLFGKMCCDAPTNYLKSNTLTTSPVSSNITQNYWYWDKQDIVPSTSRDFTISLAGIHNPILSTYIISRDYQRCSYGDILAPNVCNNDISNEKNCSKEIEYYPNVITDCNKMCIDEDTEWDVYHSDIIYDYYNNVTEYVYSIFVSNKSVNELLFSQNWCQPGTLSPNFIDKYPESLHSFIIYFDNCCDNTILLNDVNNILVSVSYPEIFEFIVNNKNNKTIGFMWNNLNIQSNEFAQFSIKLKGNLISNNNGTYYVVGINENSRCANNNIIVPNICNIKK